jgi:ribosome recycling factor
MTISEFNQRSAKIIEHFTSTLRQIRTGRATPSLIENLMVDAYGSKMPLMQIATIGAPEPRILTISVWDQSVVNSVVEALKNSDLGVNPSVDGTLVRINLPAMTEERRLELGKVVGKYAEESKISGRNLRKEYLDDVKKDEKDKKLTENEVKSEEEKIDKETKLLNEKIEDIAKQKQKELMEF